MTKPKNVSGEVPENPHEQKDTKEGVGTGGVKSAPAVAGAEARKTTAPASGRKPLGVKEVIPFGWKLVGETPDAALTLFKAVEREEVDAHLERVLREGYYKNLRVLDVDAKVKQPQPPAPPAKVRKQAKKTSRSSKNALAKMTKKAKPTAKAASSSSRASSTKKSTAKANARNKKKKTASSESSPKRSARKRKR